jgi:hypothetical protein
MGDADTARTRKGSRQSLRKKMNRSLSEEEVKVVVSGVE